MLSARNQFKGTVKEVKLGNVMAEVVVSVGPLEIVSAITRSSAETLALKPGDAVTAIIKSTEVMISKLPGARSSPRATRAPRPRRETA